jgi:ornithine carbamoyltransferase
VWRTYEQSRIDEMAAYAGVPVINALTDEFHPCQLLADLLTVQEHKGDLAGLKVAFLGDAACNMGNSWALAGAIAGMEIVFGCPDGYAPAHGTAEVTDDPIAAVTGADVVVTDTWVSMGKEEEAEARRAIFSPYAVTADLMSHATTAAIVLHCLPAYRGSEIAADVIDGPQSVVWDEAENRRHAQKAILAWLEARRHE